MQIAIEEATSFTLFGTVVTGELVGVEECCQLEPTEPSLMSHPRRINLPLV